MAIDQIITITKDISIYFSIIVLEALPFLLLGSLISSIIEEFVTQEMIQKIIPKNRVLATLFGIFMGFFIPSCDCAVIPVAARLKKKKIPTNVIVAFMLASPIINPIVLLSTWYAFYGLDMVNIGFISMPKLFILRAVFGVLVAFGVGVLMDVIFKDKILKDDEHEHDHSDDQIQACSTSNNINNNQQGKNFAVKAFWHIVSILKYTNKEFIGVFKFMVLGALVAATMQTAFAYINLTAITSNPYIAPIIMMVLAYLLSLCSTSDSFIARAFANQMPSNALLGFILLGPMIDVKNTAVLNKSFKKKFTFVFVVSIFVVVYAISIFSIMLLPGIK